MICCTLFLYVFLCIKHAIFRYRLPALPGEFCGSGGKAAKAVAPICMADICWGQARYLFVPWSPIFPKIDITNHCWASAHLTSAQSRKHRSRKPLSFSSKKNCDFPRGSYGRQPDFAHGLIFKGSLPYVFMLRNKRAGYFEAASLHCEGDSGHYFRQSFKIFIAYFRPTTIQQPYSRVRYCVRRLFLSLI